MLTMYDAVTAAHIPADATHAAYYTDGDFANEGAVRARVPHATLLSITVRGGVADCCDCETGDLTPAQAESWVAGRLAVGAWRPCVYANASTWSGGLATALAKYGDRIRRWVADYDNVGTVPAGFDAKQYSTGDVDTSVCADDFFAAKPAPKPKPKPHGTCHFEGSFNLTTGKWTIHGLPGIGVHFAKPQEWASAELQIDKSTGKWRIRSLPANSKPLGG